MTNNGYIYIFSNELFDDDVYKIGKSKNVYKRLNSYTTSYIEPLKIEYISDICKHYTAVEHEVHLRLKRYRIKSNREFFKIKLETAIEIIMNTINELDKLDEIELENYHNSSYIPVLLTTDTLIETIAEEIIDEIIDEKKVELQPIEKFLFDFCNKTDKQSIEISAKKLHELYEQYIIDSKIINTKSNLIKFGLKLKSLNIPGFSKGRRSKTGCYYFINTILLKEYIENNK
jgi:hypothetical protein